MVLEQMQILRRRKEVQLHDAVCGRGFLMSLMSKFINIFALIQLHYVKIDQSTVKKKQINIVCTCEKNLGVVLVHSNIF